MRKIEKFENGDVVKTVYESEAYIEFYCGGSGIAPSGTYVGFYYTPDGKMAVIGESPSFVQKLIPCGDGFEWREMNGDNRYYTEQIGGNFWYYEETF